MCMMGGVVTKDFGVLASDSARNEGGNLSYEFPKVFFLGGRYLLTAIGATPYFSKIDFSRFKQDFASVSLYLEEYLREMQPKVKETLKKLQSDPDYQEANLCVFVLGIHNKKPTIMNLNSFKNFKPTYVVGDERPKFVKIFHPEKEKIFTETHDFMEKKTHKYLKKGIILSPGLLGEVLVRGIYKKADLELETPPHKKYSGGVPTVGVLWTEGQARSLSNVNDVP